MREILGMNYDWKFHYGDIIDRSFDCTHKNVSMNPAWLKSGNCGVAKWGYDDSNWSDVDLPHDFVIERSEFSDKVTPSQGSLVKGIAWYRKAFELKADDRNKCISIELDGIYRNYEVWLNGHLLGMEISGYKSVSYNIDDICNYDDINVLAIRVDATEYEGWWYEGGGIYRNVRLVKTSKIHVPQWGTYVRTNVSEDYSKAVVLFDTTIKNENEETSKCTLLTEVINAEGQVVGEQKEDIDIKSFSEITIKGSINLNNINLWSIENPYLYTLKTIIKSEDDIQDIYCTTFGIRTIEFNNETGFYLNGKNIKIKGVCCHEDHAGVGVALPDSLHEYRIKLLKELGCNAYRCSHNPPTPAILEACDRLGMVVMDETRIMETCDEYVEQLQTLIKRDRNHPSVILWSVGNEEMNIQGTDIGIRIYKKLIRVAKELDDTRKTTYAMNCNWYEISDFNEKNGFSVEVAGLNYNLKRRFEGYDWIHEKYPNMILLGSENASTLSTRGLYSVEDDNKDVVMTEQSINECIFESQDRNNIVSGYGEVYPPWGSTPMETWTNITSRPFVSGGFIWTGFDYRGETIPYSYPCTISHFGIMDICGFPKDIYYYYKSWWTDEDTLHVFPHWNWKGREGELIDVCVFSNMQQVELFINDRSLGKKQVSEEEKLTWKVPYEAGTIRAVGYRDNKEIMIKEIKTTKEATVLEVSCNKENINADRSDVCVINIKALDEDGNFVQTANDELLFKVEGPGKIIGVGNGNPMSHEHNKLPKRKLYHGLCQVIIQSTLEAGDIDIIVNGKGYKETSLKIYSENIENLSYVKNVTTDKSEAKIIGRRGDADGLL